MLRALLLLLPCIVAVAVPLYNRVEPRLLGFPFFYWSLLLLVPVSAVFIFLAYRSAKR